MKALVIALCLVAGTAAAGQNGKTGGAPSTGPAKGSNEKKSKPPICEHVCIEWAPNGLCNKTEYRCN